MSRRIDHEVSWVEEQYVKVDHELSRVEEQYVKKN